MQLKTLAIWNVRATFVTEVCGTVLQMPNTTHARSPTQVMCAQQLAPLVTQQRVPRQALLLFVTKTATTAQQPTVVTCIARLTAAVAA
jgi:hypothetical protein